MIIVCPNYIFTTSATHVGADMQDKLLYINRGSWEKRELRVVWEIRLMHIKTTTWLNTGLLRQRYRSCHSRPVEVSYSHVQKSIENFIFRPKIAIFKRAGMREWSLPLCLLFQYLILNQLIVWSVQMTDFASVNWLLFPFISIYLILTI